MVTNPTSPQKHVSSRTCLFLIQRGNNFMAASGFEGSLLLFLQISTTCYLLN